MDYPVDSDIADMVKKESSMALSRQNRVKVKIQIYVHNSQKLGHIY